MRRQKNKSEPMSTEDLIKDCQGKTTQVWALTLFTTGGVIALNALLMFSKSVLCAIVFLAFAGMAFYFGNLLRQESKTI